MRHTIPLSASVLALTLVAGCGSSNAPPGTEPVDSHGQTLYVAKSDKGRAAASSASSSAVAGAVTANNTFAVDLYSQLRQQPSATGNLVTSPFSASLALTMAYAGAQGTTQTQMATALRYGAAATDIFAGQNALSQEISGRAAAAFKGATQTAKMSGQPAPSESDYQLQIVNSVWGEQTYTWNKPFLDILAEDYSTGVYVEDFLHNSDAARGTINTWVADETAQKIQNLLPPGSVTHDTRMVLVNAIHLKLPWVNTFPAAEPAAFTTAGGSTVQAPFMNQTTTFAYAEDSDAQVVGLPLAGNQVEVVIALPKGDLAAYEAGLTASSAALKVPAADANVQLSLPKFDFTSPTFSLADALKAMGMPVAFDPGSANLKGLCTSPPDGDNLYISDVLQKAMVAVQETGVEAAAATAVVMDAAAVMAPAPVVMNVNRPFVLSIVDVPTGAVLFLGHIVDPTQSTGG